jgi:O-methyltransferase domain/Dimerisation domain
MASNPALALRDMLSGTWIGPAISAAARLGLADLLRDGPRTAADLAAAAGVHPDALGRLLRALAGLGLFVEDAEGRFGLTPTGAPLRSDVPGSMRGYAIMLGEPWHREAWSALPLSVERDQPGFDAVHGMGVFDYLARHPEAGAVFAEAMTSVSRHTAEAVAAAYPLDGVETLVDVGGGHGLLLATLLAANPGVRGVLFDRPEVVAGAGALLAEQGVADRCRIAGGDFFAAVPAGGDAYVMKYIIHDWDDARCTTILGHCRAALGGRGRVLVVEHVLAPRNEPDWAKFLDLEMLVLTQGGRERTAPEFEALFAGAGLRLARVVPTAAGPSVLEAVPA